jgi:hypothetical protein
VLGVLSINMDDCRTILTLCGSYSTQQEHAPYHLCASLSIWASGGYSSEPNRRGGQTQCMQGFQQTEVWHFGCCHDPETSILIQMPMHVNAVPLLEHVAPEPPPHGMNTSTSRACSPHCRQASPLPCPAAEVLWCPDTNSIR